MAELKFIVEDISCEGCATKIRESLENLAGVEEITITVDKKLIEISGEADPVEVEKNILETGYSPKEIREVE